MPYVTYLYRDDRRNPPPGPDGIPGEQFMPTWEQVSSAILDLDNDQLRMLVISETAPTCDSGLPFGGSGMIIAGGPDVGYICEMFEETNMEIVRRAVGNEVASGTVEIVRGQPVEYDLRYCLTRDQILNATKEFFDLGILTSKSTWLTEPM